MWSTSVFFSHVVPDSSIYYITIHSEIFMSDIQEIDNYTYSASYDLLDIFFWLNHVYKMV